MIKAKFLSEQQPVKVVKDAKKVYVFICLNSVEKQEIIEGVEETYIEYDYNEIVFNEGEIDIDDIEKNPQKYLNYKVKEVTETEQLRADVDYLLMITEG